MYIHTYPYSSIPTVTLPRTLTLVNFNATIDLANEQRSAPHADSAAHEEESDAEEHHVAEIKGDLEETCVRVYWCMGVFL